MKRLLNRSEEDTLKELNAVGARHGLIVHAKVRVADVCPIENSGISRDLYRYALMAHFDFLVTDANFDPKFVVEFDGPLHDTDRTKVLDAKKDELCRIFNLPILRVRISYLPKRYNDLSILEWIIDVYHLQKAFYRAQEVGSIPADEPFDPFFIMADSMGGLLDPKARKFPYWLSRDARIAFREIHQQGKVARPSTTGLIAEDKAGVMRGFEYIKVNSTQCIMVKLAMRQQQFPVVFSDLLDELLTVFLFEKLQTYLATGEGLTPLTVTNRMCELYQSKLTMLRAHSGG